MKILGFVFAMMGYLTLYLTHPNQALIATRLPDQYRWIGLMAVIVSFIILLLKLPILVSVYMNCIAAIVMWSFLPFIPLFKRLNNTR